MEKNIISHCGPRTGLSGLASAIVGACALLLASQPAPAATATWNGTTDAAWGTTTNWNTGMVPGTGDTAIFSNAGNGNTVINLGAGITVQSLLFDSTWASSYVIGSGGAGNQTLTLNNGGSITMNANTVNNQLIQAALVLGTDATAQAYTFTNNNTSMLLNFTGPISGGSGGVAGAKTLTLTGAGGGTISGGISNGGAAALAITKAGTGTWVLSGANAHTGATTISAGVLRLANANAVQNSTLTNNAANGVTFAGGVLNYNLGGLAGTGAFALTDVTGANVNLTVGANGANTTYSGVLSGAGNLIKTGSGSLTLTAQNSFTGNIVVNAGTLVANLQRNVANPTTTALGNGQTAGRTITVNNGGTLLMTNGNILGSATSTPQVRIIINEGALVRSAVTTVGGGVSGGDANVLGPITMNGGTLTTGNGFSNLFQGIILSNTVTVRGSVASTINTDVADTVANGVMLNGTITFDVADATANANTDLLVSARLVWVPNSTTGGSLLKTGNGTMQITGANAYTGATTIRGGLLKVGNGTTGSLNGTTGTALNFTGTGAIEFNEAAGSSQGMGALTFTTGEGTVTSTYGGSGNTTLTFASYARSAGATGNFVVSGGVNGTTNKIVLTGVTTGAFMNTGTFFGGSRYAFYDATGFVRDLQYGVDAGADTFVGGATLTGTHVQTTGAITAQATTTFTTLNIHGNHNVTLAGGATLTVSGILKSENVAGGSIISGGTGIQAASGAELVIRTDGVNDALSITTAILNNGTSALTKSGAGTLVLSGTNTYAGATTVNSGVLRATTSASALGAGTLSLAGGELQLANDTALNFGRNTTITGDARLTSDRLTAGAGVTHTLGTLSIGAQRLTIAGGSNVTSGAAGVAVGATTFTAAPVFHIVNPTAGGTTTLSLGAVTNGGFGVTFTGNGNLAQTGIISGAGGVTFGGLSAAGGDPFSGVATFNLINTYTGNTVVNSGTLTLAAGGGSGAIRGALTINSGALVNLSAVDALGFNNDATRVAQVNINGGTLNNTTAGNQGLRTNFSLTGGTMTSTGGGAYNFTNGFGITTIASTVTSTVTANVVARDAGPIVFTSAQGATASGVDLLVSGVLSGSAVTKAGAGTLHLSGNNTFTGLISLNGGILRASTAGINGGDTTNGITFNGGTLQAAAGGIATGKAITLTGAGTFDTNGNASTLSGNITGTGLFTKAGAGALTLSGGANAYSGGLTVAGGSVIVNNANTGVLGSGTVTMGVGTTIDLNGNSQSTGLLRTQDDASAVSITSNNAVGSPTLTLTGTGTETFGGAISNGLASSLSIIKAGTGTQTFSGINTYTGTTQITGGMLRINGRLGNTSVNVGTAGVLGGTGSIAGLVTLAGSGSAINLQDGTVGTLTLSSGLTLTGGNSLFFDLGATGDSIGLTGGPFTFSSGIASVNLLNLAGYGAGTYNLITGATGINLANFQLYSSSLAGFNLALNVTGGNTLTLSVLASTAPPVAYWKGDVDGFWSTNNAGNTNFTSDAAGTTDVGGLLDGTSAVTFSATGAALENNTTLGANIAIRSLTIATTNAVGIGGANSLTLVDPTALTINAGAGALSITAQQVILGSNQTWTNNSSNAATITSAISGARALTLAGTGAFTFSGNNTYSGGTTLSAATTLNINSSGTGASNSALGTGTFTINGGTINNTSGSLVTLGTNNAMAWNADFIFGGANNLNLGTGAVTLGTNRTVTTQGTGTLTVGGVISGAGLGLTKAGTGTLELAGQNTFTGATIVNQGTLRISGVVNAPNTANVGIVTVGSAANLNAILSIEGGTLNASKNTSPSIAVGSVANSRGFVKMTSGAITTGSEFHLGRGAGAFAAMSMSGGTVASASWFVVGFNNDRAILNHSNGDITLAANRMTIGAGGAGSIGVYNASGTATFNATGGNGGMFVGENGLGTLNVSDSANVNLAVNGLIFGQVANSNGTVNLLGGTITTNRVIKGAGTGTFNFNGGTLKANATNATFMTGLTNAFVYSGGAKIDSGGFDITIAQPLQAPTGSGVSSIAVTDGGSGYVDTPVVVLSGGSGSGATAIATVVSGVVTGFVITNPGTGYVVGDVLTVTLHGGGATTAATAGTISLAANTSGGLTKSGAGVLTLSGTNTYTGGTSITGGTLALGHATNTLADTGTVTVNGGALDIGANAETVGGLTLVSGSITGTTGVITASSYSMQSGTVSGILGGSGALTKTTAGSVSVTSANTYTGATTVSAGRLLANNATGSATGTGNVIVESAGRLGGIGRVGVLGGTQSITVNSGGVIEVGNTGDIASETLDLATSGAGTISLLGTLEFDIYDNLGGENPAASNDQLFLFSDTSIVLSGTLKVTDTTTFSATDWAEGDKWRLLDWSGVTAGTKFTGGFTTLDLPTLDSGLSWITSADASGFYIAVAVVPEPDRALLLLGGLTLLVTHRRRRPMSTM
ncbi:autotransporter-associated beta strand repeat-containing protein [Roseimicrobium sp. ORNL1]|uniref:autotransporter-associated beta strand repeat-containing protein n=1 Tax=Roseimicrobium sp. ORNL1 TaxID=2711231 RepID=UPI0013E19A98|nr:autotransporter-associated beta strand repeat-containing protein [Roseimicrobium sp. ORNL1]QIF02857.1 PEP-CTERM sorting domain-containing protein [Roseimicrobium sp. ORNL1]